MVPSNGPQQYNSQWKVFMCYYYGCPEESSKWKGSICFHIKNQVFLKYVWCVPTYLHSGVHTYVFVWYEITIPSICSGQSTISSKINLKGIVRKTCWSPWCTWWWHNYVTCFMLSQCHQCHIFSKGIVCPERADLHQATIQIVFQVCDMYINSKFILTTDIREICEVG